MRRFWMRCFYHSSTRRVVRLSFFASPSFTRCEHKLQQRLNKTHVEKVAQHLKRCNNKLGSFLSEEKRNTQEARTFGVHKSFIFQCIKQLLTPGGGIPGIPGGGTPGGGLIPGGIIPGGDIPKTKIFVNVISTNSFMASTFN